MEDEKVEVRPPEATVNITLKVEMEYLPEFLESWADTVARLIEIGRCEFAEIVLPTGSSKLPLRTW